MVGFAEGNWRCEIIYNAWNMIMGYDIRLDEVDGCGILDGHIMLGIEQIIRVSVHIWLPLYRSPIYPELLI